MPTTSVLSSTPTQRATSPATIVAIAVGAVVLALVLSLVAVTPAHVGRISVVNDTAYDLAVDVSSGGNGGWIAIGHAGRGRTSVVEEVFDVGDAWVFRFRGQGEVGATVQVSRRALSSTGWTVEVPASVGAALQAKGLQPPP